MLDSEETFEAPSLMTFFFHPLRHVALKIVLVYRSPWGPDLTVQVGPVLQTGVFQILVLSPAALDNLLHSQLLTISAVTSSTPRTGFDQYPISLWRTSLLPLLGSPAGTPHRD